MASLILGGLNQGETRVEARKGNHSKGNLAQVFLSDRALIQMEFLLKWGMLPKQKTMVYFSIYLLYASTSNSF